MTDYSVKLSVITVNLNNREGLQKTIDSVVEQSCTDFEWIVIDGGSTDGSRELIERFSDRMAYWVSEPDGGIYNGMNKGILASRGEYLLFLNSGDALCDAALVSMVLPLLQGEDFYVGDIAYSPVSMKLDNEQDICSALTKVSLPHQATFTRRTVFEKYGLYREDIMIAADWWLTYTALVLGDATVVKLPFAVSLYDNNGISSVRSNVLADERNRLLSELPRVKLLNDFYRDNADIVKAIKWSRLSFYIFRIYYYIYRKVSKRR